VIDRYVIHGPALSIAVKPVPSRTFRQTRRERVRGDSNRRKTFLLAPAGRCAGC